MKRPLIVLVLLLMACSDDDDPSGDACEDVYAEGRPTEDVLDDYESSGGTCANGDRLLAPLLGTEDCADGREVHYNDLGYGIDGDTWHEYEPGAELVPPAGTC